MKPARLFPALALAALLGLAWIRPSPPSGATAMKPAPPAVVPVPNSAPSALPETAPRRSPPSPSASWSWTREDRERIAALEERLLARLREEPSFEDAVFQAFLQEPDPMWMSFLQNLLAADPRRRNAPAWQDRFARVAETESVAARRRAALLFLQQAETVGPVRDRLFALAEQSDLRGPALLALKGLPGRRPADPDLDRLAARRADVDPDPAVRALAARLARPR
ncbi:MAG TPA: hypothetical protein VNO22_07330 [Planctomycetota bacterium]|nr:hypothetical protein [Planctomycetota bacterium]